MRHVVELLSILPNQELKPYLTLFSDSGADHNVTFLFDQCMLLALLRIGEFDILNVERCTSAQSYINPAERAMSLLNIGLQGIIYSCGTVVNITPLYTKRGLVCASDVESAIYTTRAVDRYICLYCGAQYFDAASFRQLRKQYKTVFSDLRPLSIKWQRRNQAQ